MCVLPLQRKCYDWLQSLSSKPRTRVGDNAYKREGQSDNTSETSIILVGLQKAFDVTLNINNRVYAG